MIKYPMEKEIYIKLKLIDWLHAHCFYCSKKAKEIPIFRVSLENFVCDEVPLSLSSCPLCLGKVVEKYIPILKMREKYKYEEGVGIERMSEKLHKEELKRNAETWPPVP